MISDAYSGIFLSCYCFGNSIACTVLVGVGGVGILSVGVREVRIVIGVFALVPVMSLSGSNWSIRTGKEIGRVTYDYIPGIRVIEWLISVVEGECS